MIDFIFVYVFTDSFKDNWFGVNFLDLLPLQLMKLGCLVIAVFSASFGPFIAMVKFICCYSNLPICQRAVVPRAKKVVHGINCSFVQVAFLMLKSFSIIMS